MTENAEMGMEGVGSRSYNFIPDSFSLLWGVDAKGNAGIRTNFSRIYDSVLFPIIFQCSNIEILLNAQVTFNFCSNSFSSKINRL